MADVKICSTVSDVLGRATIEGNILKLPEGQLERPVYDKVAKAIKAAGGKWKTNLKGFLFESDPRPKLGLLAEAGAVIVDQKKARQSYYTPGGIAEIVVEEADVGGEWVLEPSAGDGNLVREIKAQGAYRICAVEIHEECRGFLEGTADAVHIGDFLTMTPEELGDFDRVVMNPPFTKNQYFKHVQHALQFLKDGGSLYAIVPDNGCQKLAKLGAEIIQTFDAGAFKESGTMVSTCLIRIQARG